MVNKGKNHLNISHAITLAPQRFDISIDNQTLITGLANLHLVADELQATPASSLDSNVAFTYVTIDEQLLKFHFKRMTHFNLQIEVTGTMEQITPNTISVSGSASITPETINQLLTYLTAMILIPVLVLAIMLFTQQLSPILQFLAILTWIIGAGVITANLLFLRQNLLLRIIHKLRE